MSVSHCSSWKSEYSCLYFRIRCICSFWYVINSSFSKLEHLNAHMPPVSMHFPIERKKMITCSVTLQLIQIDILTVFNPTSSSLPSSVPGIFLLAHQSLFPALCWFAAGYNNLEVAEYLLEHGADVNAQDKGGLIPLHNAASYGVRLIRIHQALQLTSHLFRLVKSKGQH